LRDDDRDANGVPLNVCSAPQNPRQIPWFKFEHLNRYRFLDRQGLLQGPCREILSAWND